MTEDHNMSLSGLVFGGFEGAPVTDSG
jgi:hypothetical protein